jgi:hypothetical protein
LIVDSNSVPGLNTRFGQRTVTLVLRDGASFTTEDARFSLDSTAWSAKGSGSRHAAATRDVIELSFKSRPQGALDGFLVSFAIGAPFGVLLIDNPAGSASDVANRGEAALAGGVGFGIFGLPIGAILGSRIHYRLRAPN